MKNVFDFESGNDSPHDFNDELLLALERSGKTLVEIQAIVLPWANPKSEKMITVGGKQYSNNDNGFSNRSQKRIRVRELLDATFVAKEQALAAFQGITRVHKQIVEDKRAAEMRFKYLADVAKREYGVVTSVKRKFAPNSPNPGGLEGFHDYRPNKKHYADFGVDDLEDFSSMKAELPKEEILDGIKLEESRGNRLKRPKIGLLRRDWKSVPFKHESQSRSKSSTPSGFFLTKREVSEESSLSPNIYPMNERGNSQHHRAICRLSDFGEDTSPRSTKSALIIEDETTAQKIDDHGNIQTGGPVASGLYLADSEGDERSNNLSDMNDFEFTVSKLSEYDATEMLSTAAVADDTNITSTDTDVDIVALRDHKPRVEYDYQGEEYGSPSISTASDTLVDLFNEDAKSDAVRIFSHVGVSESSILDPSSPAVTTSDASDPDTGDADASISNGIAPNARCVSDADGSDISRGSVQKPIEISTDDESE